MSNLVNQYPYTNFHDVNLDYIIKLVRENEGLYLETVGNLLVAKNAAGAIVSSVTIPYATTAGSADTAASANYAATAGTAATAQHAATADTATTASSAAEAAHAAAADTATTATTATNAANATYATSAGSATNATNAVNAQNAEYAASAGTVEHVTNAIEEATTWLNSLRFIKGDGTDIFVQPPFAKAAAKDNLGNVIDATYFASVVNDNGALKFKDANGAVIASVTPSSMIASQDDYGNLIASYIKAIAAGSNYLTVTHGDGTTETLTIQYSESAWKDTNGNVIKNFYAGSMECVEDDQTGHYNLVVYNGDTPKAELYRFEIYAYKAQEAEEADHAAAADYATDAGHAATADSATVASQTPNGDTIQEYAKEISANDSTYGLQHLITKDGDGNITANIDLFKTSRIVVGFVDQDQTNPNSPYNLSVGASETYQLVSADVDKYGFSSFWDVLEAGIYLGYVNENNLMIMWAPIYYSNGYYMSSVYDYQGNAFKTFRFTKGSGDYDLLVERFA